MRKWLVLWAASIVAASAAADVVVNNNLGATASAGFTQSGASTLVFGSTVIVAYNDSGSYSPGVSNRFSGYSRSLDGGLTFTDMGPFPSGASGDAGYAHLARHNASGTVYSTALTFSGGLQLFRSSDGGATFAPPVGVGTAAVVANFNAIAVDNAAGAGNGNVYVVSEDFGVANGLRLFRSVDGGSTFGPGLVLSSGGPGGGLGPSVTVGPDHRVTVAYLDRTGVAPVIRVRSSTDAGQTFGAPSVAANLIAPLGGDLGLVGLRNGTAVPASFRSNLNPQIVANPVTGQIYMVYADKGVGGDKADVLLRSSLDGGLTWSAAQRINGDGGSNDQWQPTLTVTPDGKHLGVFWYDRRNDGANNRIEYYGRQCDTAAGLPICGAEFVVSDQSFLPEFGRDSTVSPGYMGDYDNAAADDDYFYVSWGDNRSPLAGGGDRMDPNVFFDRIAVIGGPGNGGRLPEPATLWLVALASLAALARAGTKTR